MQSVSVFLYGTPNKQRILPYTAVTN